MCIAQGLAHHINTNAKKLRRKFVEHKGKKEIVVRRDDFVKASPENPWPEVFDEFSEQIRKHIGEKTHDLLTPEYSTTGSAEKAAAQVVLMDIALKITSATSFIQGVEFHRSLSRAQLMTGRNSETEPSDWLNTILSGGLKR